MRIHITIILPGSLARISVAVSSDPSNAPTASKAINTARPFSSKP